MTRQTTLGYVGVIADGSTDQEILSTLAKCLLGVDSWREILLGQSLAATMERFRRAVQATGQFGICQQPARDFRKTVITLLHAAVGEFRTQLPRQVTDSDLIILSTDAEWHLSTQDRYFEEEWAQILGKVLNTAIEEFYHTAGNRHLWQELPLIIPLVLFPSTDILVAAARSAGDAQFNHHGKRAREIKRDLYKVDDLRFLKTDDLQQMALDYINADNCKIIYRHLPESRLFLRTLFWKRALPS